MLTEDGKCECAPCPPASCQLGHRPVQVRPALDRETPGSCCPLYECRLAGNFFLINRALFSSDRETIRETRPSLHWHPSIPVELLRICRYSGERVVEDRARMRPPRSKLDGIRFGIRLRFTRDVSTGTIRRWRVRFPAPQTRLFVDTSNLSTTGYSLESVHRPRPGVLLRINDEERVIAYVDTCNVHRRFRLPRRARLSDKSGDRDAKGGRILYLRGQGEKVGRTMATVGLRKLRLSRGRCILSRTDVQVLRKCDSSRSWRVLSSLSAAYERDVSRTPTALSNIVGRMRVNVPEWLRHGRK